MKKIVSLSLILTVAACATVWSVSLVPGATKPGTTAQQGVDTQKQPVVQPGGPGPGARMMPPPMFRPDPTCVVTAVGLPPTNFVLGTANPLGLSDDQIKKLKPVLEPAQETVNRLREKAAAQNRDLRESVTGTADREQIRKLLVAVQATETDIANTEIDAWLQVKAIMTADQFKKMTVLMHGIAMMGMRGPGGPPPGMQGRPGPGGPGGADPNTTN